MTEPIRIMRRVMYTNGKPCQLVLTDLDDGRLIVSFHDDTGTEEIGTQQIAVVVPRLQFRSDALALAHQAGDE